MESYDILVIVLSIALSLSIIIWVIVGVLVIQVLKRIRAATDTAKAAAEHVEAFTSHLQSAGKAAAFGSVIKQASKFFKGRK